jgi:hypothetical protein
MPIVYKHEIIPTAAQIITLYNNAGLPRPTGDTERIKKMYDHSNLIVTAWEQYWLVLPVVLRTGAGAATWPILLCNLVIKKKALVKS